MRQDPLEDSEGEENKDPGVAKEMKVLLVEKVQTINALR